MKVVDANVLIYAANGDTAHHDEARTWLDLALSGADTVGFTWLVVTAFVRISTKVGVFPTPLLPAEAFAQVGDWLDAPGARTLEPSAAHLVVLERVLSQVGTGGNLVSDAHLAAVAMEHRASVVSYGADFGRFEGVRWWRPGQLLPS